MRSFNYFIFFFLLLFAANDSISQNLRAQFDSIYNRDPSLYNGIIFSDIYTRSVAGTQFFKENSFKRNDLGLKDKVFEQEYINYDVYNQKLLLTYLDDNYAQKMIELPIENVTFFKIDDSYFEVLIDPENNYKIYEVFEVKEGKLLVNWTKYMKKNSSTGKYSYRFSDIQRQVWLLKNEEYFRIKNNKTFLTYIADNQNIEVQKYFKSTKFKIQKADSIALRKFIQFLNTLE